jgi:hypothetical protein
LTKSKLASSILLAILIAIVGQAQAKSPDPLVLSLTANPTTVTLGNPITLSWSVINGSDVLFSCIGESTDNSWSGTGSTSKESVSGQPIVTPTSTTGSVTYTLICTDNDQNADTVTATVAVEINGVCGPANGADAVNRPATGLCNVGTASQVSGNGPWNWTCAGSYGGTPASCSDLLTTNGVCGPANGVDAASPPTTGLCNVGTPSQVSGNGPWDWTCAGSNGGSPASCSDLLITNGVCGPANGADAATPPTTGLCNVGAPSQISGNGPWDWTCAGSNGGSPASCSDLLIVDGVCGSANGADAATPPTTGLCNVGAPSQISGNGPWDWTCAGSNGGSPASCSDIYTTKGTCGPANGADAATPPTTGLCTIGTPSAVNGNGPWNWTCAGSGPPAHCSDLLVTNGACGSANGADAWNAPTKGLCSAGTASTVNGNGPWNWTCSGVNGGTPASCSDLLIAQGVCGSANLADTLTVPTTNLCSLGTPSVVTGSGPWNWTCAGPNGGPSSYCHDYLMTNGACGSANGADVSKAPTYYLCSAGTASTVSGTGPWNWTCTGYNGGSTANCNDFLITNGVCGSANGIAVPSEPTSNLCSAGLPSAVSGTGPWNWTCAGLYTGTTASCSDWPVGVGFNYLGTSANSFNPGTTTLSGYPTITYTNQNNPPVTASSVGFQDGAYVIPKAVNGSSLPPKTIYYPWQLQTGGSTWIQSIQDGIPQSVMLSYNSSAGVAGFSDPSNWTWFDMATSLSWLGKGTLPNTPAGYTGGAVAGNMIYPAPDGNNHNPIFIAYDSSQPVNSPGAYQTFVPPAPGASSPIGRKYGWCEAVYDGRFIYYVPMTGANGYSGNIVRYDTTQPFDNSNGLGWSAFDMGMYVSSNAIGFQSAAYDGYRFIYFIPFHQGENLLVRFDTWGGGVSPNPAAFSNASSYTTLNPTLLGSVGYPPLTGVGNPANLAGFTGAAIAWDSNHEVEYLYFVPWGTYPNGVGNPVLQSTTARVNVGQMSGTNWNCVDITSANPTSLCPATSATWEIYDLNQLTLNPAWPASWTTTWPAYETMWAGQSEIAGFQIAYVTTSPMSLVGFVPDKSQYFVEHSVDQPLSSASAWYVAPIPQGYIGGTMGGGYDSVNQILYASSPKNPLFSIQFTLPQQ